jgi:hypothetical protein
MRFIHASVPKDRPVDVRIRLALGAEIPGPIDLERFPGGVIDRVPQIEGYRYIVVEDDVVIVDPNDRLVALVITEDKAQSEDRRSCSEPEYKRSRSRP